MGRGEGLPSARKDSEADVSPCPSSEAGRDWMDCILHSAPTRGQPEVTHSEEVAVRTQGCSRFPGTWLLSHPGAWECPSQTGTRRADCTCPQCGTSTRELVHNVQGVRTPSAPQGEVNRAQECGWLGVCREKPLRALGTTPRGRTHAQ